MSWVIGAILISLGLLVLLTLVQLESISEIRCPVCGTKFADVFGLRRHLKEQGKKG